MKKFLLLIMLIFICLVSLVFAFILNPDDVVGGDTGVCFVYQGVSCPDESSPIIFVGPHFFDRYGAHVSTYGFDGENFTGFNQVLCCVNITSSGGGYDGVLFSYDQLPSNEHGVHAKPTGFGSIDVAIGNNVTYANTCPENYLCAVQVQEDGTGNFTETHIFDCDTSESVTGGNLMKLCYENPILPPVEGMCEDGEYQTECDPNQEGLGEGAHDGTRLYCNFGDDDEMQIGEIGHCCELGQYWDDLIGYCADSQECGFESFNDCSLNNGTGVDMDLYLQTYYFEQMSYGHDCIDLSTHQSCCYQVERFGTIGNFYCDIITTT